jgi:CBS domain-containing protein
MGKIADILAKKGSQVYTISQTETVFEAVKRMVEHNAGCLLVTVVHPETSVEEAMAIMTDRRFRHLPVVDSGKLVGLVSIGDLVKQISQDRKFEIQYLTDYITGKYPG